MSIFYMLINKILGRYFGNNSVWALSAVFSLPSICLSSASVYYKT